MATGGCDAAPVSPAEPVEKARLGLLTSLPILWSGSDAFAVLAGDDGSDPHWAVATIQHSYILDPVDAISPESLRDIDILVLAQPRILSPEENVALDDWVRAGGHVLVFADPQLVGDYDIPLGDPRRPLDSVLLSPILQRWGLELVHDLDTEQLRTISLGEADMAVAAAGRFAASSAEGTQCRVGFDRLLANCVIGNGRAVLLADATLVEDPVGGEGSGAALEALLGMAREAVRENAGETRE